jgi:hypothetical protein
MSTRAVCRAGRGSAAAELDGAGEPVQCLRGGRLETDDEVVDAEPLVRVDRPGQLVGGPAAGLAGIGHLAVDAHGAA